MITNIYCQKMSCGKEVDIQGDFCDMHREVGSDTNHKEIKMSHKSKAIEPQKDTTIEVISITEQDDGSAIVTMEMGSEAIRLFVQKAFIDILTEMIKMEKNNGSK